MFKVLKEYDFTQADMAYLNRGMDDLREREPIKIMNTLNKCKLRHKTLGIFWYCGQTSWMSDDTGNIFNHTELETYFQEKKIRPK
jgi:hypothetical protein